MGIPPEHLLNYQEWYPDDHLQVQINFLLPPEEPAGNTSLSVIFPDGTRSNVISVIVPAITPPPPRILAVTNNADSGLDILARGPKSQIRVLVDQLEPEVTVEDIKIKLNDEWISPEKVVFIPGNVFWEVTAQLPDTISSGESTLQIQAKGLLSLATVILIQES